MMKEYYTYAYMREDGTPYYIGKGKGNRAFRKHKVGTPSRDKIIFLKTNLTEEESFDHEKYMIYVLGRKDLGTGILENKNAGGNGSSGKIYSEQEREKIRNDVIGKKWWNNGTENSHSKFCPGDGWIPGRIITWNESERLDNMKKGSSKILYRLIHISGEVAYCKNLHELGKKCGCRNAFYRVLFGQRKSYKGWISVRRCNDDIPINEDENKIIDLCESNSKKKYKLTHKDGKIMYSDDIRQLGKEYGNPGGFHRVMKGDRLSYKGWISVEIV